MQSNRTRAASRRTRPLAASMPRAGALAFALIAAATGGASAETCFRQCLAGRVTSSAMTDDQIRYEMKGCRDRCDREAETAAAGHGWAKALAACRPEPVDVETFRAIRAASPSYVVQSNAFTWDLANPFADKAIREIEIVVQGLDLAETVMTAPALVLPGEQATVLVTGFFDGYPNARYATRVKALLACPVE